MTKTGRERDYGRVLTRARELRREAETCAKAGAYLAACVMLAAALEAVLLATAMQCQEELVGRGRWPKGDPLRWDLGVLVPLAVEAGWLTWFDVHEGELEEQAEGLWWLRNQVHAGAFIREAPPDGIVDRHLYLEFHAVLKSTFAATAISRRAARISP